MADYQVPPQPVLGVLHRLGAGLFHSLEVAAFQRDSLYGVPTRFGPLGVHPGNNPGAGATGPVPFGPAPALSPL